MTTSPFSSLFFLHTQPFAFRSSVPTWNTLRNHYPQRQNKEEADAPLILPPLPSSSYPCCSPQLSRARGALPKRARAHHHVVHDARTHTAQSTLSSPRAAIHRWLARRIRKKGLCQIQGCAIRRAMYSAFRKRRKLEALMRHA